MNVFYRTLLYISLLCFLSFLLLFITGYGSSWIGFLLTTMLILLALGVREFDGLRDYAFTIWVFAAASAGMFYPEYIRDVGGYNTEGLIVPLVQLIMFGMGTALSVKDFTGVIRMPKGVFVGLMCQFIIMPVTGITLALSFGLPAEIAAGVVLIGSSPSGVASNVMTFLAKGNLALSVTLTTVATLIAPLMTPFLMQTFAGQFVPIVFYDMMMSIVNMIILPVAAGLIFNRIFRGKAQWLHNAMPGISMAGIVVILAIIIAAGRDSLINIGILLIGAAIIHNAVGYFLGYWGCRLFKMDEKSCRTIAFEVGMQNGGLASGIAADMGRAATMGLAPAIFGTWMNISGSYLANYWRKRPLETEDEDDAVITEDNATESKV
ncbi:MAG: bile acid:sodium symporter family protein [Balneolaceae bacterium]